MNCKQFNTIPLEEVLLSLGHLPTKQNEKEAWYLNPFASESQASFKINKSLNKWYLFSEGIGGNNTDFMKKYLNTSVNGVLIWAENQNFSSFQNQEISNRKSEDPTKNYEILDVNGIQHPALLEYLRERKVGNQTQFLHEIHYRMNDKNYFGIGFKNDSGGYEIRNKYSKICLGKKDTSAIKNGSDSLRIFEGFFDFLSFKNIEKFLEKEPSDYIILNSVSMISKIKDSIENYENIELYFDNDEVGNRAVEMIKNENKNAEDCRILYNMVLSFFPTAEGYYDYENLRYIYQYKDHLGNVRVSYVKNGNDLEVRDRNDYYPFGMSFLKGNQLSVFDPMAIPYNYKYNGKELQETGMYDYGARFYMPDIGKFGTIDPRSEYTKESYSYVWNNPIRFLDPTGMEGEEASAGSGGSENGSQVTTGCCPDEVAPNKPGGINNPRVIEQVNLTAPGKPIENKSAGVSLNNSYQVQLAGVNSKPAFVQAYPIYQALMWAVGAIASYEVAEKATDVIFNPPTYRTMGDDDDVTGEIDIEGVVIPGLKKIDDSGIKVPVDVLGGLRVNFARGKGERGFAGKTSGTDNPYKHVKPDTTKPGNVIYKHPQSGKKVSRPASPGEKEHFGLK